MDYLRRKTTLCPGRTTHSYWFYRESKQFFDEKNSGIGKME